MLSIKNIFFYSFKKMWSNGIEIDHLESQNTKGRNLNDFFQLFFRHKICKQQRFNHHDCGKEKRMKFYFSIMQWRNFPLTLKLLDLFLQKKIFYNEDNFNLHSKHALKKGVNSTNILSANALYTLVYKFPSPFAGVTFLINLCANIKTSILRLN